MTHNELLNSMDEQDRNIVRVLSDEHMSVTGKANPYHIAMLTGKYPHIAFVINIGGDRPALSISERSEISA